MIPAVSIGLGMILAGGLLYMLGYRAAYLNREAYYGTVLDEMTEVCDEETTRITELLGDNQCH